jgi:cyclophilin family peptidyl-prolyl cis-trans isomerase
MMRAYLLTALLCLMLQAKTEAGVLAQFRTVLGDIDVELYEKDKPITVANFIHYIQTGRYQNGFIHRCDPTFVVQGGGWWIYGRGTANAQAFEVNTFDAIPNEYGVGNTYSNRYGTIAMAQNASLGTNSANSQWFFNLSDNFFLDDHSYGNYFVVFGRVVRGTNVLNKFRTFTTSHGGAAETNTIVDYGSPFNELPLLGPGTNATESTLIYCDISLLNVQVTKSGSARQISWNSVLARTNRVEFTTNFPPVWSLLVATNGTGTNMNVLDSNNSAPNRFYRVKVDY